MPAKGLTGHWKERVLPFIVEEIDLQELQLCKGDTEYETKSRSVDFRSEI
jgi:hypothetical protein